MDNIRTYPVGNGEITLTEQDAEELRVMLQTEYLTKVINGIIDEHIDELQFHGPRSRRRLVDELVRINSDLINYDSIYYEETMQENMFDTAHDRGLLR